MTFADLRPGDVLMSGNTPQWVVIKCSYLENIFVYLVLRGAKAGEFIDPNLSALGLWNDQTFLSIDYDGVLRAGKLLSLKS